MEWWQRNHAIYQKNKYTSLENKEVEPAQLVQMNIYQSNTYRIPDYSVHGLMVDLLKIQSNLRKKKLYRTKQGSNILETTLAIEIMEEPQSNLEDKVNPSILKDDFSSRTDPFIFISVAPVLIEWSHETNWVFPALKSTNHLLPQSTVSCRTILLRTEKVGSIMYHIWYISDINSNFMINFEWFTLVQSLFIWHM